MRIIKRDGSETTFDPDKIVNAIKGANADIRSKGMDSKTLNEDGIKYIAAVVTHTCEELGHIPTVEEVQDLVQNQLMQLGKYDLATAYITYRYEHQQAREGSVLDKRVLAIVEGNSEEARQENSNKNVDVVSVQRDYIAGEVSRDLTRRMLITEEVKDAHDQGIIHFHDTDYFLTHEHNCGVYNLDDMLQNGTVISGTMIEKPHSFSTACNIATQVIAQIASSSYGGQTFTLAHLAPFVDISRKKFARRLDMQLQEAGTEIDDATFNSIVEGQVRDEVKKGIQTIQYQLITLMTTNGQAPFVSVFMWINEVPEGQIRKDLALMIEETIKQRYQGVKDETGHWITPAFPKLLYVLDENNTYEDSEYFYLTKLAAKCTAKRLVPDYISAKKMRELKLSKGETPGNGDVYGCMGCRSFLTPDRSGNGYNNIARAKNWVPDQPKYYGRFNQGVVTINLPDVALSSGGNIDLFWKIFEERLELCHRALRLRHERLLGTPSDVAPILWQYGAIARFNKGEKIDPLLFDGYSTISLGYAGLYECVRYMTGHSHTEKPEGHDFGIAVMQKMNDKCAEWKAAENIDYSIYGTPIESTTYKFAKCLQRRFGIVPGVTDHGYITNSYHVNVREDINAFDKLAFESEFQHLSPGGAISYVEVPDMQDNLEAVIKVMQFIYENIIYAELNTKSDLCEVCGYDGEIQSVEVDGKYIWECPHCGNRDQSKMHVARRTCGYIGTQFWNQGRTEEIRDRVMHL